MTRLSVSRSRVRLPDHAGPLRVLLVLEWIFSRYSSFPHQHQKHIDTWEEI